MKINCTYCVTATPAVYACACGTGCGVYTCELHKRFVVSANRIATTDADKDKGESK